MPKWKKLLRRQALIVARRLSVPQPVRRQSPSPPAGSFEPMEPRLLMSASLTGDQLASRFADRFGAAGGGITQTLEPAVPTFQLARYSGSTQAYLSGSPVEDTTTAPSPGTARGTGDADTLISYASQGELIGRAGNDTFVVAPAVFTASDDVLVKGGGGDDTFWIMGGRATVKGGKGYDVVFVGDANATVLGVEEVWVRDPDTFAWTLSEGRSQQVTNGEDAASPVFTAAATASANTLPAPDALALANFGGGTPLASLATGPLDGDLTGDGVLDAADLDVALGHLNDLKANTPDVAYGNVRNGVTAQDTATGHGFILFSAEPIRSRFNSSSFHTQHADHFLAVQHLDGQWYYHNNDEPLTAFTPAADDVLMAEIDFTANTARDLEGRAGKYEGISFGRLSGYLAVIPEQWGTTNNVGEFRLSTSSFYGLDFKPNPSGPGAAPEATDLFTDGVFNTLDVNHLLFGLLGTKHGDADLDGFIGQDDLNQVLDHWGQHGTWAQGNFDGSATTIGTSDRNEILLNWGWSAATAVTLQGTFNHDVLYGFGGNDTLHGGAGHDFIWGAAGIDTIDGGDGIDTIVDLGQADFIYSAESIDHDDDDLSNIQELALGTNLDSADSDGDRMPDGWEYRYWDGESNELDPTRFNSDQEDFDGDGLSDLGEYLKSTFPDNADTDGDETSDYEEIQQNRDPLWAVSDNLLDPEYYLSQTIWIGGGGLLGEPLDNVSASCTVGGFTNALGDGNSSAFAYLRKGEAYKAKAELNTRLGEDESISFNVGSGSSLGKYFVENWQDGIFPDGYVQGTPYHFNYSERYHTDAFDSTYFQWGYNTEKTLIVPRLNLNIDSDNNNGLLPPEDSFIENNIENTSVKYIPQSTQSNQYLIPFSVEISDNYDDIEYEHLGFSLKYDEDYFTVYADSLGQVELLPSQGNTYTQNDLGLSPGNKATLYVKANAGITPFYTYGTGPRSRISISGFAGFYPYEIDGITINSGISIDMGSDQVFVQAFLPEIDLAIDTNNDGSLTTSDDQDEDSLAGQPGHLITLNRGDSDLDGIPDYADGYNFDGVNDSGGVTDSLSIDDRFSRLEISIPDGLDPEIAKLQFEYDSSSPSAVIRSGDGSLESPFVYEPAAGSLRIWTQDASVARDGRSIHAPDEGARGDFVQDGVPIGLDHFDVVDNKITLWVEAIEPSESLADLRINLKLDPYGSGFDDALSDAVRLTAFGTTQYTHDEQGTLVDSVTPGLSHPTPVFTNVNFQLSNYRLDDDKTRVLGDLSISAALDDALSDLIEGTEGQIDQVSLFHNGNTQPLATLATQATKTPSDDVLKPYDFSATLAHTLTGIELQPGVNQFYLSASNAHGYTGFAEQAIEVLLEAPNDQTYEYEIRVHEDPYTNSSSTVTLELRTRAEGGVWGSWRTLERDDFDTFSEASPVLGAAILDLHANQPLDGTGSETRTWATITDPDTENLGENIELQLDRFDSVTGDAVWVGRWTREEHDLVDLERYTITTGEASAITASSGGEFHPFFIGLDGPTELLEVLGEAEFFGDEVEGPATYQLAEFKELALLFGVDQDQPNVFLNLETLSQATEAGTSADTPEDPIATPTQDFSATQFSKGIGRGLLETIPEAVAGLWDTTKFIAKRLNDYQGFNVGLRFGQTGNPVTVEDQAIIKSAYNVATKLAGIYGKVTTDAEGAVWAWATGDDAELNAIGEEYRVAFEFAAELFDALWSEIAGLPDFEKGRIVGRILGEVLLSIGLSAASGGAALAAKSPTMTGVVTKLRQVPYLQGFASRFDEMQAFYYRLAQTDMCFVAGTLVHTAEGFKPIEEVAVGDRVLSRDESTHEQGFKQVLDTFVTRPDRLYRVAYTVYGGSPEELVGTGEHPFYVHNKRAFVPIKLLAVGDVLCLSDNQPAVITAITTEDAPRGETFTTYNFEVEGYHTYFVGREGADVWVHNRGDGCERVAAMLYNIQRKNPELEDWASFERLLERTEALDRRKAVDPHLMQAANEVMNSAYRKAADILRNNPNNIDEALALVPSHTKVNQVMFGRRQKAAIESHHTATRKWARTMLENTGLPQYQGLTKPEWNIILDEMPIYLMDRAFHRQGSDLIPEFRDIHNIIRSEMRGVDGSDNAKILESLERAMDLADVEWGGNGTGDDIWLVARAWLKKNGVQ